MAKAHNVHGRRAVIELLESLHGCRVVQKRSADGERWQPTMRRRKGVAGGVEVLVEGMKKCILNATYNPDTAAPVRLGAIERPGNSVHYPRVWLYVEL